MACGLRSATYDGKERDAVKLTNVLFKVGKECTSLSANTMKVIIRYLPERDRDVPDVLENTCKFSRISARVDPHALGR